MRQHPSRSEERHRVTFYIGRERLSKLDRLARTLGESRCVLIRKGINMVLELNKFMIQNPDL